MLLHSHENPVTSHVLQMGNLLLNGMLNITQFSKQQHEKFHLVHLPKTSIRKYECTYFILGNKYWGRLNSLLQKSTPDSHIWSGQTLHKNSTILNIWVFSLNSLSYFKVPQYFISPFIVPVWVYHSSHYSLLHTHPPHRITHTRILMFLLLSPLQWNFP